MVKTYLYSLAFLAFFTCSHTAQAHMPIVTLTEIPVLEYESFPQTYTVRGVINHNPIDTIRDLTLFINGEVHAVIAVPYEIGSIGPLPFEIDWNIIDEGVYTVTVSARHGAAGMTGFADEVEITVFELTSPVVDVCPNIEEVQESVPHGYIIVEGECVPDVQPPVVVECLPAPAHAAHHMREIGIKPTHFLFKNIVSYVARHMGPQNAFDGVVACDIEYPLVVRGFVDDLLK